MAKVTRSTVTFTLELNEDEAARLAAILGEVCGTDALTDVYEVLADHFNPDSHYSGDYSYNGWTFDRETMRFEKKEDDDA